jgi:hypothetical protein
VVLLEDFTTRQVFPLDNWWNLDISSAPVDGNSTTYIDFVSGRDPSHPTATRSLHPDFGPPPYGIPYVGVSGGQAHLPLTWTYYGDQSDDGAAGLPPGYPIPDEARLLPNYIEGGEAGGGASGDRHLLLVDRDNWRLFETVYRVEPPAATGKPARRHSTRHERPAARGVDLRHAAGLAIFPGWCATTDSPPRPSARLPRDVRATNGYVWPASHEAGSTAGALPMGARLRLKASVDISGYPAGVQRIFQAMKTYGLIVADNGSDLYVSGTMDPRWDNDVLNPGSAS